MTIVNPHKWSEPTPLQRDEDWVFLVAQLLRPAGHGSISRSVVWQALCLCVGDAARFPLATTQGTAQGPPTASRNTEFLLSETGPSFFTDSCSFNCTVTPHTHRISRGFFSFFFLSIWILLRNTQTILPWVTIRGMHLVTIRPIPSAKTFQDQSPLEAYCSLECHSIIVHAAATRYIWSALR